MRQRGSDRGLDVPLAVSAHVLRAAVIREPGPPLAWVGEVEVAAVGARAPRVAVVFPGAGRVVRAVAAADDEVLAVSRGLADQQHGTRPGHAGALSGEPAPLAHTFRVGIPLGLDLHPERAERGEDREVRQVENAAAQVEALRLVLPLQVEAVEKYGPSRLEVGPEKRPGV